MRMRGKILVLTATLLQLTCSPVSAIDRDGALKSLRRSHFSLSKNSTGVERGSIEQQDAIDIQPSLLESLRPLLLKGRFSRHASHMARAWAHSPLEDQDLTPAEEVIPFVRPNVQNSGLEALSHWLPWKYQANSFKVKVSLIEG